MARRKPKGRKAKQRPTYNYAELLRTRAILEEPEANIVTVEALQNEQRFRAWQARKAGRPQPDPLWRQWARVIMRVLP